MYELITDLDLGIEDIKDFEKAIQYLSHGNMQEAKNIFERLYRDYKDYLSGYYLNIISNTKDMDSVNSDLSVIQFDKKNKANYGYN